MKTIPIIIGLSSNVEQVYDNEKAEEKSTLTGLRYGLAGSSANVCAAVRACSVSGSVIAFTGKIPDLEPQTSQTLANLITYQTTQEVIEYERRNGLNIETIPVLDYDHYAITPTAGGLTFGRKGTIIARSDYELAKQKLAQFSNGECFRFSSGIRPNEIELAQVMLGITRGKRALNVKPEILSDQEMRESLLPYTDFLFMNEKEFESSKLGLKTIHEMGVQFIAVTNGPHGLLWSFNNELRVQHGATVKNVVRPFTTGCGDWFAGTFIASLIRMNADFNNLSVEILDKAVKIANTVAAEKTRYSGSSNGPDKLFLDNLF